MICVELFEIAPVDRFPSTRFKSALTRALILACIFRKVFILCAPSAVWHTGPFGTLTGLSRFSVCFFFFSVFGHCSLSCKIIFYFAVPIFFHLYDIVNHLVDIIFCTHSIKIHIFKNMFIILNFSTLALVILSQAPFFQYGRITLFLSLQRSCFNDNSLLPNSNKKT